MLNLNACKVMTRDTDAKFEEDCRNRDFAGIGPGLT